MEYKHKYTPLDNVLKIVDEIVSECGLTSDKDGGRFQSLDLKAQVCIY